MLCNECLASFFFNPFKMGIVIASFLIALASLIFINKGYVDLKKKLLLIYIHIFFMVFPFIFYLFFRGCQTLFSGCEMLRPTMMMLVLTFFSACIIGLISAPFLFMSRYLKKSLNIDDEHILRITRIYSKKLRMLPPGVYLVDIAKPVAFSFSFIKRRIFISVGLFDILNKNEINAVLLHELAHVRNRFSIFKLSALLIKLSPLAMFSSFSKELDEEEAIADRIAAQFQKTDRYLTSAKEKISLFNRLAGQSKEHKSAYDYHRNI